MEQVKVSIRQEATLFIPFPLCKESRQNTNKNQKKKKCKEYKPYPSSRENSRSGKLGMSLQHF